MKPKFRYANQSEIPEALKSFYIEKDGGWVIDIEGAADAAKLNEFRDNNIALAKERDTLKATWDGLNPDDVKALIAKKAEIEAQKSKDKGEIEQLITDRTAAMKDLHQKELDKIKADYDKTRTELKTLKIDSAILEVGTTLGLRETAHQDLIFRARTVFELDENGNVVAMKDGKVIYNGNAEPITIKDWVNTTAKDAPHLFKESSGGGAPGGKGGQGGGGFSGKNPFKAESMNLTEQGKLINTDRPLAARLAQEAGVSIPGLTV
jgi:hypothetical protein